MKTANLRADGARLLDRLQRLGEIGALEGGGVCRLALSEEDRQARDLVVGWMRELGLEVRIDAIGNIFGTRPGREPGPPVMTGSHIDTVATGGLYDGALGVLAGLEVVEVLNEAGITTRHPLTVAVFTNEEGARFAPDMMGSLVFVGGMALAEARATTGIDGATVGACLDAIGYAGSEPVGRPEVRAFVELHVEQGPVLDEEGVTIGAVEGVQGIAWSEYTFEGVANHAGTTPMRLRRDAGLVAAELIAFLRRIATETGGHQVATAGRLVLEPGLVNVVPERATVTVDLRNTDETVLQRVDAAVEAFARERAAAEGVSMRRRVLARFAPVAFDPDLVGRVEATARALGHTVRRLPSGAGHDAQMLARVCPTAMIFVPSEDGISHNVRESTRPEHLTAGADVLLQVLLDLAGTDGEERR